MSKRSIRMSLTLSAAAGIIAFGAVPSAVAQPHGGGDAIYLGRVVAKGGLTIRTEPTTSAAVLDRVPYGERLAIVCKASSQPVHGNARWYLLVGLDEEAEDNLQFGWAPASAIANIGPAPAWC